MRGNAAGRVISPLAITCRAQLTVREATFYLMKNFIVEF